MITPQVTPTNELIATLHGHHLCKKIDMVDKRSNINFYNLNSKPNGLQSLGDLIV